MGQWGAVSIRRHPRSSEGSMVDLLDGIVVVCWRSWEASLALDEAVSVCEVMLGLLQNDAAACGQRATW